MKFELEEHHRDIDEKELLNDLKRVASKLKKNSVTCREQNKYGEYSITPFKKRFGSWFNALKKAGLQKTMTPTNVPKEELFRNLEEVWTKIGRQPRYREMIKPLSKYLGGVYTNRFGTWRKALEKFILYVNNKDLASLEQSMTNVEVEKISKHKTKREANWRLRFLVMRRDNFKCKVCGRSPATNPEIVLHVDHIKAWANGGETTFENLQTLCSKCNIGKSNL